MDAKSQLSNRSTLSISRAMALSALILFYPTLQFPLLDISLHQISNSTSLRETILNLFIEHHPFLGVTVALTTVLIPLFFLLNIIYLTGDRKDSSINRSLLHLLFYIKDWHMIDVFLLGVLVSLIKLVKDFELALGSGFYFTIVLTMMITLADHYLNLPLLWKKITTLPMPHEHFKPTSFQRSLALTITALILYFPANFYPIMIIERFDGSRADTILSGIIVLFQHGSVFIAAVVFCASIAIPLIKIVALFYLLYRSKHPTTNNQLTTKLANILDFIGKWSMLDIYVISILMAIVNLGILTRIKTGPASIFFTLVVIVTILASHSFDVRLLNRKEEQK